MGCAQSKRLKVDAGVLLKPGFREKYEIGDLVGSGSFARVFKVTARRKPGRVCVVKIMEDSGWSTEDWSTRAVFLREATLLKSFKHAHIVQSFDFYQEDEMLYMVMEVLLGGELFKHLLSRSRLEEEATKHLVIQMLSALSYLHANNVIYRDVKADNFVFTDHRCTTIKMIDFGLAVVVEKRDLPLSEMCGSPHYLSPELLGQSYGFAVDLWALGVLVFLLLHGKYPFEAPNTQELVEVILNGDISQQISDRISVEGRAFLTGLCEPEEKTRLTVAASLAHPWVSMRDRKYLRKTATDSELDESRQISDKITIHRQLSLPMHTS